MPPPYKLREAVLRGISTSSSGRAAQGCRRNKPLRGRVLNWCWCQRLKAAVFQLP
jgi:hypothetical protein